jgi:hypothetical protein
LRFLLIVSLLPLAMPSFAMTITVEQRGPLQAGSTPVRPIYAIRMTGLIERGDADALRKALERVKAAATFGPDGTLANVELSSNGGDVFEGVKIGYIFREFAAGTLVRASDICFSACALAFLGGSALPAAGVPSPWRNIEPGGQVGFHNIWLNQSGLQNSVRGEASNSAVAGFGMARAGASLIIRYLTDMGIDGGFAARLLGRPIDQFDYIATAGSFVELQTCLTRPVAVTASVEQQAGNICSNSIGPAALGGSGKVRPVAVHDVRLALLREVERQVVYSTANSRFIDRFRAVVAAGEEPALIHLYENLRSVGLALPDLSGTTFDVTPMPASLKLSCKVSLPADYPDGYDLVVVGPRGLSVPAHAAPERCRWMARHAPADTINPARHAAASPSASPVVTLKPRSAPPE